MARTRVFLSGVASVTHLVYAASYLRPLVGSGEQVTLVDLGSTAFLGRHNVTAADVEARLPDGLARGHGLGASRDERLVYLAVGAPGIKPLLRLRAAHPGRRLHVVVVDEGLGSYGDWRSRRDAWRRQGGGRVWPAVRALAVTGADRIAADERWVLYREQGPSWVVDDAVAAELRRVPPEPTAEAVLLTQPWVELGILARSELDAQVTRVRAACAEAGLPLRVRPHPAERTATESSSTPAELDPAVVGASVVLGTASTALLNVAAVHGTPALRVALPRVAEVDARLSTRQRSLLDAFLPPPLPAEDLVAALRTALESG